MKYLWWIVAALCGVAAISVFFAFQNPEFVVGLTAAALTALFQALRPHLKNLFKPMDLTPAEKLEWDFLIRSGASQKEINAWQKMRRRRKLQK